MNRREMLAAGFRHLARALPGLVTGRRPGFLTGGRGTPPHQKALSFPPKEQEPSRQGHKPLPEEDEVWP